jgi:hypothetical protein
MGGSSFPHLAVISLGQESMSDNVLQYTQIARSEQLHFTVCQADGERGKARPRMIRKTPCGDV